MSLASILRDRLYVYEIQDRLHPIELWRIGDDLAVCINGTSVKTLTMATSILEPLGYELSSWGTEGATYTILVPVLRFAPRP
jgi:hypothetical protein